MHLYKRFHDRFGTAGVVIAVIALITALGGTALAAGGLTAQQEKQVKKIAKKYAGKDGAAGTAGANGTNGTNGKDGAVGPEGQQGPQGNQGSVGATGPAGATGAIGATGTAGVKGATGGTGVAGATGATGATGSPWPVGTAPAGTVLKGTWSLPYFEALGATEKVFTDVASTGVPIAPNAIKWKVVRDPGFVFASPEQQALVESYCPGTASAPTLNPAGTPGGTPPVPPAEGGLLCVYVNTDTNLNPPAPNSNTGAAWPTASATVSPGGGFIARFEAIVEGRASAYGTWIMVTGA